MTRMPPIRLNCDALKIPRNPDRVSSVDSNPTRFAGISLHRVAFFQGMRNRTPIKIDGKDYKFLGVDASCRRVSVEDPETYRAIELGINGAILEARGQRMDCTGPQTQLSKIDR